MENFALDIYNQICDHQYVSFDLFDTLVKRSVSSPERVFELVEISFNEKYGRNIGNFKKKRIQAEMEARKFKTKEDVTLNEIYNYLVYEEKTKELLMKEEKNIEVAICLPNISIIEIYYMCLREGKNVIITTDMYLDRNTISQILSGIGIIEYTLFLSSETGYTKQTGNLFNYIISNLNIQNSELVHIGDNKRSDYDNAIAKGINAIWLPDKKNPLRYWKKSRNICDDHLYTILKNKQFLPENKEKNLGYKLIGPILFNFCMWVNNEDKIKRFDKIAFIAREGYLLYLMYKKLFPCQKDKILYLRINKNSLRLPALYLNNSIDTFLHFVPEKKTYSILNVIELLYIDKNRKEVSDLLWKYHYTFESILKKKEMFFDSNFVAFYKECIKIQKYEIKKQYEFLIRYLSENNVKGKVALVNNSINANAQYGLQLIKERCSLDMELWGMHFIISQKGIKKIEHQCSVWFDNRCCQFEKRLFYRNCLIFEHLLFESHGTALYYSDENNKIEVICKNRGNEVKNDEVIEKVVAGAMEFADDYVKRMPLCTSPLLNLNALCNFYLRPSSEDIRLIDSLKDDEDEQNNLLGQWEQGRRILKNKGVFLYNLWLHMELILRKMF